MFGLAEYGGVALVQSQRFLDLSVRHAITTRLGGVSRQPFHTLNMGLHTGDKPANVIRNRELVCTALGAPLSSFVAGQQIHGSAYYVATEKDMGRGATEEQSQLPATDILITQTPGVILASFYADCVAVLLADLKRRAVGVAHCGWRGTWQEAARMAVEAMGREFGSIPAELAVVLGPSIGPCCYEVSAELARDFREKFGEDIALGNRLDLRLANVRSLEGAGIRRTSIHVAPWCTRCQQDLFFSHRGSGGRTGRMAALIGLPDPVP